MVGRWFFMIIGTIFSITPAFVYWLAGWLAIQGDPTAPTIGDIVAAVPMQRWIEIARSVRANR